MTTGDSNPPPADPDDPDDEARDDEARDDEARDDEADESKPNAAPDVEASPVPLAIGVGLVIAALMGIVVWGVQSAGSDSMEVAAGTYVMHVPPPRERHFDTQVARGESLFHSRGCFVCHGERGRGGVVNRNYVLGTVPALDGMAERFMLWEPEDAQFVVDMLERGEDPEEFHGEPPFATWGRFLAQYDAVLSVLRNGNPASKQDPNGHAPPMQMLSWRDQLSRSEMNAIIAYLVTLYDWDDEDDPEADSEAGLTAPPAGGRASTAVRHS